MPFLFSNQGAHERAMDQGATEQGSPVIGHPAARGSMLIRRHAVWWFLALVSAGSVLLGQASGAEPGVRHRIDVVVSAEPNAPILEHLRGGRGTLSFTVRLSANSRESRFYGMLHPNFAGIVVPDKAGEPLVRQTKIWEEDICHQRRGLPKVTVTQLGGSFGGGGDKIEISAINRHIGLLVPPDELTPGIKLEPSSDEGGAFFAFRAQTRNSRLNVDLKIYPIDCFL